MIATILIPVVAFSISPIGGREDQILRQFAASVDGYMRVHRMASEAIPRALCGGPEELEIYQTDLANEIRSRRAQVREGSIFTSDIGSLFRIRLRAAAIEVIDDEDVDGRPVRWIAEVNEGYPPNASAPPPGFFRDLPPLPEELEYRLFGRDLVIVDVTADLVVDVLRDAVRETPRTKGGRP